jgi:quinolinate synthase
MVHERFSAPELRAYRALHPGIQIIAHPECPPDVLEEADFVGSTAGMIGWIKNERPRQVVMVTECSMSDNVAAEAPATEILRPCNLCPHMKRITVTGIRDSLLHMQHEVTVAPEIAVRARVAVERMLEVPA